MLFPNLFSIKLSAILVLSFEVLCPFCYGGWFFNLVNFLISRDEKLNLLTWKWIVVQKYRTKNVTNSIYPKRLLVWCQSVWNWGFNFWVQFPLSSDTNWKISSCCLIPVSEMFYFTFGLFQASICCLPYFFISLTLGDNDLWFYLGVRSVKEISQSVMK